MRGYLLVFVFVSAGLHAQESHSEVIKAYFAGHRYDEITRLVESGISYADLTTSALADVAKSYFYLGNNNRSLEAYRMVQLRSDATSLMLVDFSLVLTEVSRYDSASNVLKTAIPRLELAADTIGLAKAMNAAGILNLRQSHHVAALDDFHVAEQKAASLPSLISFIRSNQGIVYRQLGQYRTALSCYREALSLDSAEGRSADMAVDWLNMGNVLYDLDDYDNAEIHFEKARGSFQAAGDSAGLTLASGNLGAVYQKTGRFEKARPLIEQGVRYADRQGDRLQRLSLLQEMAFGDMRMKKWNSAARLLDSAYSEAEKLRSRLDQFTILLLQAEICRNRGFFGESESCLQRALVLCRSQQMAFEWLVLAERATLWEWQNRLSEAEADRRRAVLLLEKMREDRMPESDLPEFFSGSRRGNYRGLVELLIRQQRWQEAFAVTEGFRGRMLDHHFSQDAEDSTVVPVSYFVSDSAVFAFVGPKPFRLFRLGQTADIRRRVTWHMAQLKVRNRRDSLLFSDELFDDLVQPFLSQIDPGKTVVITPDDFLHGLIFESLTRAGRFWIERNPIAYSPSVGLGQGGQMFFEGRRDTLYLVCEGNYRPWHDIFPLADLPFLELEKTCVKKIWKTVVDDPSPIMKSTVRSRLQQAPGIVHIGAHGMSTERGQSALVFARTGDEDGILTIEEIRGLKVRPKLIVLSACATASGFLSGGEGVANLPMALLNAGARGVICSAWEVNDAASVTFMGAFYDGLARGDSVPEALRDAKLECLKSPDHRAPYYWAGMVLWIVN